MPCGQTTHSFDVEEPRTDKSAEPFGGYEFGIVPAEGGAVAAGPCEDTEQEGACLHLMTFWLPLESRRKSGL
ncbi:hypothetical protein SKAU_G00146490 [Synaphobranchus kaupii]|uniref:Uncharacterized protein n=1 Tax=Synaphobranchus kaupii TaxID=118154 RepID=A0A9Q1FTJ6_SYNKA|nr:hypothetical protein SKAU_G00146490 [Synaphobranchus kaupii]